MKAVISDVPADLLAERKRTGADRWDEMWNGVLHMPPAPVIDHQDFEYQLEHWLRRHWGGPQGYRVYHNINVASIGGWPHDYRVPDLVLVDSERFHIMHREYFEGPPLVVIEIHSSGDEAYDKLEWYAALGIPETWIIDRDSCVPKVFVLNGRDYTERAPDADGWFISRASGIQLRTKRPKKLVLQLGDDAGTRAALPES